jgi:ATP-dependent Lon protease
MQTDRLLRANPLELAVGLEADIFEADEPQLDADGLMTCPLIPLREMVMYPRMISPLFVGRERSILAATAATSTDHALIVVAQRDGEVEDPQPEDLYAIGAQVTLGRPLRMPDGMVNVLAQGRQRVEIVEYVQWEPYVRVRARPLPDLVAQAEDLEALMRTVLTLFEKAVSLSQTLPEDIYVFAMNIDEPGWLADLVASALRLELPARQELLELLDPIARLRRTSVLLAKELDLMELEDQIHSSVQEQLDRSQREVFLREQMKAIQSELGEGDLYAQEIADLRERAESKAFPEHVKTQFQREMARLAGMPPMAPETGVIRSYLGWLLDLPWAERTEDRLDLRAAAAVLDADHYGLTKAKERILEFLAVKQLAPDKMHSPVLCFVGPPGTGKTSLGKSIAGALNRSFVRVSLGGVRDEAEIRGHRRTYVGALPGRIIQTMRRAGTINPVFMLDEIDKLGADFRGDPSAALLEVLDPEQNRAFSDHYMELDYDLSEVLFITTANYLDPIPPALQDRLETIEFLGYSEEEKIEIARRFLIPKELTANGVSERGVAFGNEALRVLIRQYTYEAGVRNLERELARICRKLARRVAEQRRFPHVIQEKHVNRLLGPPEFMSILPMDRDEIGVATGVAWTPNGGDLIAIEVSLLPEGKGAITITGQLGEVMQESAQTAFSYLRSRADGLGIPRKAFGRLDVHIHAPEGAVPKDGPSAGITLATALVSAFTNRPVRRTVGMTGEITLRGRILPVGGIKEKVLTARRSGLTHLILPRLNQKDLVEVPRRLLRGLDLVLVDRMDEVLEAALLPPPAEEEE